jgi:cbb3-type cytochrome oxidase cytochrome c subunit
MKLRSLALTFAIAGLLAPVTLLAADQAKPAKPKHPASCENVSGTRILPSPKNACHAAIQPMRTYTKEDLDRTGEFSMAEALRKIDPIFH